MSKIEVHWSEEDGEWAATHPDYPSLSYLSSDYDEALSGLEIILEAEGLPDD